LKLAAFYTGGDINWVISMVIETAFLMLTLGANMVGTGNNFVCFPDPAD